MKIWRLCCRAALGLVCLIFAGEAKAIELFRAVPLSDDGHGSNARAVMLGVNSNTIRQVVGSKISGSGISVPMVWTVNVNDDATSVIGTELPLPIGAEGEAVGGAAFPNGDRVAIGNVTSNLEHWGVLWRKPALGDWGMPQVVCPDAVESWVARAFYINEMGVLATTGSALEGGRWRAELHRISAIDVQTVDLPTPPGLNSAAIGIDGAMGGSSQPNTLLWIGGWITTRQGRMRPVVWTDAGQGWATFPIDLPAGAEGQVNAIQALESVWKIAGDASRGGRTRGFSVTTGSLPSGLTLLEPLNGYADSSAIDLSTDGGATFGTSINPGGPPIATGWIGDSPFPAQQLLFDPGSVAEVRGFQPADIDNSTFGQIVPTAGGEPQACVFKPTMTHVPDRIDIAVGNISASGGVGPYTFLWHNDNNELRIRTERVGGMLKAQADLQFTPLGGPSSPNSIHYDLIARADGNQPGASGTLNVYAFNFSSQTWVPAGSFAVTSKELVYSGESGGMNEGFVNPQSGAVRLRLEFIANGNRPTAMVAKMAQMNMQ